MNQRFAASPIAHDSLADRAAEYLRRLIADGDLKPGERIIEAEISAALGVSRSPVREAIIRLAQDGLITILPYRGALVAHFTRERCKQLLDFRLALEELAVKLIIEHASDAEIRALLEPINQLRAISASEQLSESTHLHFFAHEQLIALAKNDFLAQSYQATAVLMRLYIRMTSMQHYQCTQELIDDHERIVHALLARDADRARALMREHIEHGFEAVSATLPSAF
jgi:DNA-binding GntR family transcriptional regulator